MYLTQTVEARQVTKETIHEVAAWCGDRVEKWADSRVNGNPFESIFVRIKGQVFRHADYGEWIIVFPDGTKDVVNEEYLNLYFTTTK